VKYQGIDDAIDGGRGRGAVEEATEDVRRGQPIEHTELFAKPRGFFNR
jgi:hypothetical protein